MTGMYLKTWPAMKKVAMIIGQNISHIFVTLWKLYRAGRALREAYTKDCVSTYS